MSTSHRVITVHPSIVRPNLLHIMQGVLKELNNDPNFKVETITIDRHRMESFSIYFTYGEEKRRLFMCESQDTYQDVDDNPINSGGAYFNLNVWGRSKEIMEVVKAGIRKHDMCDIYESFADSIDDRFVRVES